MSDVNPKFVLVVDDDPVIHALMSFALARQGFKVQTAEDARVGLALIKDQRFDVLFTDWRLPGTSGLELAAGARQQWSDMIIILMTAAAASRQFAQAVDMRTVDFILAKPFSLDELESLLGQISIKARRAKGA